MTFQRISRLFSKCNERGNLPVSLLCEVAFPPCRNRIAGDRGQSSVIRSTGLRAPKRGNGWPCAPPKLFAPEIEVAVLRPNAKQSRFGAAPCSCPWRMATFNAPTSRHSGIMVTGLGESRALWPALPSPAHAQRARRPAGSCRGRPARPCSS